MRKKRNKQIYKTMLLWNSYWRQLIHVHRKGKLHCHLTLMQFIFWLWVEHQHLWLPLSLIESFKKWWLEFNWCNCHAFIGYYFCCCCCRFSWYSVHTAQEEELKKMYRPRRHIGRHPIETTYAYEFISMTSVDWTINTWKAEGMSKMFATSVDIH